MGETIFKLDRILKEVDITPNKLAELSNIRPDTVYRIYKNDLKRIHISHITSLLDAINKYCKDNQRYNNYEISDLIKYIP